MFEIFSAFLGNILTLSQKRIYSNIVTNLELMGSLLFLFVLQAVSSESVKSDSLQFDETFLFLLLVKFESYQSTQSLHYNVN